MKRQIVLENDQLIEMVNESAKRVLRGLMSEGFLGSALANTANVLKIASMLPMVPSIMNGVEKLVGGGDNGSPQNQGGSPYQGNAYGNYDSGKSVNPLGSGQYEGKPQQVSAEDLIKLYQTNPEAFQAIAQNPSLLSQMGGSSDTMSQLASDPKLQALLQLI